MILYMTRNNGLRFTIERVIATHGIERRMTCPRCSGRMFPDPMGDTACLMCGHVEYATEPLPWVANLKPAHRGRGLDALKGYAQQLKSLAMDRGA